MHARAQQIEPLPVAAEARKRQKPEAGRAKGTVAEARRGRGRGERTRAYLDGGARSSPPASPCQGHTSSSSTPRAKVESRRPGTSRQPDRGHFCSLVCLPIEGKSCWCLGLGVNHERRDAGRRGLIGGWAKLTMADCSERRRRRTGR